MDCSVHSILHGLNGCCVDLGYDLIKYFLELMVTILIKAISGSTVASLSGTDIPLLLPEKNLDKLTPQESNVGCILSQLHCYFRYYLTHAYCKSDLHFFMWRSMKQSSILCFKFGAHQLQLLLILS